MSEQMQNPEATEEYINHVKGELAELRGIAAEIKSYGESPETEEMKMKLASAEMQIELKEKELKGMGIDLDNTGERDEE